MKNMKSLITSGLLSLAALVGCSTQSKASVGSDGWVPIPSYVPPTPVKTVTPAQTVDVQILKPVQTQQVQVQVAQPVQVRPVQVQQVQPVVVQPVKVQPVVVQQVQPVQPVVVKTVEVAPVYTPVVVPTPIVPWYDRWSFSWLWSWNRPHHCHPAPVVHHGPAPRHIRHHQSPAPQHHHRGHHR